MPHAMKLCCAKDFFHICSEREPNRTKSMSPLRNGMVINKSLFHLTLSISLTKITMTY